MSEAAVASNVDGHGVQPYRILFAFALTPVLPGFYATIFYAQPWAFPLGAAASYSATLLLGVPLFFLARRFGWLRWWQLALCGMLCAVPVVLCYWHLGTPPHLEQAFNCYQAIQLEAWGGFSGLAFWLIALAGSTPLRPRMLLGSGF
jgi:hypothetical protein